MTRNKDAEDYVQNLRAERDRLKGILRALGLSDGADVCPTCERAWYAAVGCGGEACPFCALDDLKAEREGAETELARVTQERNNVEEHFDVYIRGVGPEALDAAKLRGELLVEREKREAAEAVLRRLVTESEDAWIASELPSLSAEMVALVNDARALMGWKKVEE